MKRRVIIVKQIIPIPNSIKVNIKHIVMVNSLVTLIVVLNKILTVKILENINIINLLN